MRAGATVTRADDGALTVEGLNAVQIGDLARTDQFTVHELTPVQASLEDAFMQLTQDSVDYRSSTSAPLATTGGRP